VAFGFSVLAKQPGLLDFGVALVLLVLSWLIVPESRRKLSRLMAWLIVGFAHPIGLTCLYFAFHGAWRDLIYYTWTYNNTLYVPEVPRWERWQTISVPFELAWEYHPLVPVLGVLAAVFLLHRVIRHTFRRPRLFDIFAWLILGWCASGLVATTLGGRGFTHYSIQLIPGLSLACGWLTVRVISFIRQWIGSSKFRLLTGLVITTSVTIWLLLPLLSRLQALRLPEPGSEVMNELVHQQSSSTDRIFVWGYNPEIYAMSGRLPATRFLYCTFLTGIIPWTNLDPLRNTDYAVVPGAWDDFLADWNRHPPRLIADGRSQRGFLKFPIDKQRVLWPLIERDYAQIEIDKTNLIGFWLFRRLESNTPTAVPDLPASDEIQLQMEPTNIGHMARVEVRAPVGTVLVELFIDGNLYRRLQCAPAASVSVCFFVLPQDRSSSGNKIQVLANGEYGSLLSAEQKLEVIKPVTAIGGPPLRFLDQNIGAVESSTITGGPILPKPDDPSHWDAHPPSRLVYPWLEGMN